MQLICNECREAVELINAIPVAGVDGNMYVCPECHTPLATCTYEELERVGNELDEYEELKTGVVSAIKASDHNTLTLTDNELAVLLKSVDIQIDKTERVLDVLEDIRLKLTGEDD